MEQAMEEINQAIKLDSGAVKKIFSISGKQVELNVAVVFFCNVL